MIEQVTALIINDLYNHGKPKTAELAALRRSSSLMDPRMTVAYPVIFRYLPEKYISTNGKPTYAENALFMALHAYAILQRGQNQNVNGTLPLFSALKNMRTDGLDRRMKHLMRINSFDQMKPLLNGIIHQLQNQEQGFNFSQFAKDLYSMQFDYFSNRHVLMRWGDQYFSK